jgi:hypothetical protein
VFGLTVQLFHQDACLARQVHKSKLVNPAPPKRKEAGELHAVYANYFQIGHNAFEFFLDFGQRFDTPVSGRLHTRVIATPAHVKELFELLSRSLAEFERVHGAINKGGRI